MAEINSVETSFWDFKGVEPDNDNNFLIATPYPIICILVSYLWFVLKFGPEYMKKREPFNLSYILPVYNAIQVLVSLYIVYMGTQLLLHIGFVSKTCYYDEEESIKEKMIYSKNVYFFAKLSELLDTVFFVLRKKQNQVSFLQVHHHTVMAGGTWLVTKYHQGDCITFFGFINSLVHVIMYTYYGLAMYPSLKKYLWWKKYITVIQMIQLSLILVHLITFYLVSDCKPNYIYMFNIGGNTILLLILFGIFYIKTYNNKKVAKNRQLDRLENAKKYPTDDRKIA